MPFGEEIYAGVGARSAALKYSSSGTDNIRKRFTGYEKDDETELDFADNRMYQGKHGRFTSVDPLLDSGYLFAPQTFNRYVYTGNNPVNFTDPDGLDYYQDKKTGKIHYYAGSDVRDGFTNITGQAREITGAGCDELGNCADVGDLLLFHSDSVEYISVFRQEQEAKATGTEVLDGVNPELLGTRSDIVSDNILRSEIQLIPIPQEGPAIHDLLMGASPTLDIWETPIHIASIPALTLAGSPWLVGGAAPSTLPLGLPRTVAPRPPRGDFSSTPFKSTPASAPYGRPSGATTRAQRSAVNTPQGKVACNTCGRTGQKNVADHKEPLVKEYYRTGKIDPVKMRDVRSTQPQCGACSNKQSHAMRKFSMRMRKMVPN